MSDNLQLILSVCQLAVMVFAFYKFLRKPHDTLEEKVTKMEGKIEEIDKSLRQGNDKFREQQETNEMFISCMLSFINFEIAYCIHTGYEHDKDLIKAKETLEHYLAKR